MRYGLGCLLLVLGACSLKPDYNGTLYACGEDGACPDSYACVDQRCVPTEPEAAACTVAMAAGTDHTCAIRTDGTAWCWGRNNVGQLGDGTSEERTTPVQVVVSPGLKLPRFTKIEGGTNHSCALGDDGTVWCWGSNVTGQLGTGTTNGSLTAVPVSDVKDATAITTGAAHSCALRGTGELMCWGANNAGQLGIGSMTKLSPSPALVAALGGVRKVVAGGDTTCAVTDQGLSCWGSDTAGQLGDGLKAPRLTPMPVPVDATVTQVSVGAELTCALTDAGAVLCAGQNAQGQLGQGTLINPVPPAKLTRVPLSRGAVAITAGDRFACALDDQAQVWCWGEGDNNQLADSVAANQPVPALTTYTHAAEIAGGGSHLCVSSTTGGITCSGYNGHGQLGDRHRTTQGVPQLVPGLTDVVTIDGGGQNMCVTHTDGTVTCWGDNTTGALGDGARSQKTAPTAVELGASASRIAVGDGFACAVLTDQTAMCWGSNGMGELGDGSLQSHGLPKRVGGSATTPLLGIRELAASTQRACTLGDGGANCWGRGTPVPTPVAGTSSLQGLAVGDHHACGINAGGSVSCWGDNLFGQLGNGTNVDSATPTPVSMLGSVDQLTASTNFTCAHITSDNTIKCWGDGPNGELGLGMSTRSTMPVSPSSLTDTLKVVAGGAHVCALKNNKTVVCWGANSLGQLGAGDYVPQPTPPPIPAISGVRDLAASSRSTCAVLDDGTVWCWGDDRRGQLGHGGAARTTPAAPLLPCP